MPSRRRSTTSPTPCCPARSARCFRSWSSAQLEKALRVRRGDRYQRLAADLGQLQGLHRMRIAERKRVIRADDDLRRAKALDQETDRGGIEHQLIVIEASCGGRRRFG